MCVWQAQSRGMIWRWLHCEHFGMANFEHMWNHVRNPVLLRKTGRDAICSRMVCDAYYALSKRRLRPPGSFLCIRHYDDYTSWYGKLVFPEIELATALIAIHLNQNFWFKMRRYKIKKWRWICLPLAGLSKFKFDHTDLSLAFERFWKVSLTFESKVSTSFDLFPLESLESSVMTLECWLRLNSKKFRV